MIVGSTTTSGSSKKARKTYLRMVQNVQLIGFVPKIAWVDNPIIGLLEEDARSLHHLHDDALVNIPIGDYNTHRVLVDNGSFTDILYYLAFQQMRIEKATRTNQRTTRWVRRNESIPPRCGHITCDSR